MTNPYKIKERRKEQEKALKENPLLDTGLENLIEKQITLILKNPNVTRPKSEMPNESLEDYKRYNLIKKEIHRREEEYTRIPYSEAILS